MQVIRNAFRLLNRKQKIRQVFLVFITLIGGILELLSVSAIFPLIQLLMDKGNVEDSGLFQAVSIIFPVHTRIQLISIIIIIIIGIFIIKNVYLLFQTWFVGRNAYEIQYSFTKMLVQKYMSASYSFFVRHNTSEVQINLTSNTTSFGLLFQYLMQLVAEVIVCVVMTGFILISNPTLAVSVIIVLGGGVGVYTAYSRKKLQRLGVKIQRNDKKMLQWISQSIGGIKEITILGRKRFFVQQIHGLCDGLEKDYTKNLFIIQSPHYITEMLSITSLLCSILFEVSLGVDINILIAQLATITVAAFRLLPSIGKINGLVGNLHFRTAVVDVLLAAVEELDKELAESKEVEGAKQLEFTKSIEVKQLSFSYTADNKVLDRINLQINRGSSVAFIGPSGAGKTTLADLILGVMRPDQGEIMVDGNFSIFDNIREWQKNIGYIPQSIFLSDDTIRSNVAFGVAEELIDDQEIWRALDQAQLADYVRGLPNGLNTMVGERGVRLSGGQRQRIGIARALYNNPQILVMDEATSALDGETEQEVMDAIERFHGVKTLLIIAHRLSTIENCDVIYEINEGSLRDVTTKFRS